MVTYYTHPNNARRLRQALEPLHVHQPYLGFVPLLSGVKIVESECLPETQVKQPLAVYHPDTGEELPASQFSWSPDRFTTYDAESVPWLLGLKIIRAVEEMLVYSMQDDSEGTTLFL